MTTLIRSCLSFLIHVLLIRVLFYLKPSSLKLKQKTRLNSRAFQLKYNTRGLGKREEVAQTNVMTLYLYVQQHHLAQYNIFLVYKFQFWSDIFIHQIQISLERISLSIGRVIVTILPLIMHITTAICLFPFWNGLKFSIIPVLKSALFCLFHIEKQYHLYCIYINLFSFLYLRCSPNSNQYSLFQRFLKSTKILLKQINLYSKCAWSPLFWLIDIALSLPPCLKWLGLKNSSPNS